MAFRSVRCSYWTARSSDEDTISVCKKAARSCMLKWTALKTPGDSMHRIIDAPFSIRHCRLATCVAVQFFCTESPSSSWARTGVSRVPNNTSVIVVSMCRSSILKSAFNSCRNLSGRMGRSGKRTSAKNRPMATRRRIRRANRFLFQPTERSIPTTMNTHTHSMRTRSLAGDPLVISRGGTNFRVAETLSQKGVFVH